MFHYQVTICPLLLTSRSSNIRHEVSKSNYSCKLETLKHFPQFPQKFRRFVLEFIKGLSCITNFLLFILILCWWLIRLLLFNMYIIKCDIKIKWNVVSYVNNVNRPRRKSLATWTATNIIKDADGSSTTKELPKGNVRARGIL